MNAPAETKPTAKPSALSLLLKDIESGKIKVNESDKAATTANFKKAMGERAKLEKALADFDAKADKIAVDMVKAHGGAQISVAGVRYIPTSRGPRIYYKKMSDRPDVVEL